MAKRMTVVFDDEELYAALNGHTAAAAIHRFLRLGPGGVHERALERSSAQATAGIPSKCIIHPWGPSDQLFEKRAQGEPFSCQGVRDGV